MNRLFIIGNGFDIAHGLKTKYCDFINDFWKNVELVKRDDLIYINPQRGMKPLIKNEIIDYSSFMAQILKSSDLPNLKVERFKDKISLTGYRTVDLFRFNNEFFKIITLKNGIENWVDIEREYYYQLKKIAKSIKLVDESDDDFNTRIRQQISVLNDEFEQIKELFENYLKENIDSKIQKNNMIKDVFDFLKVSVWKYGEEKEKFLEEFPEKDRDEIARENEKKRGMSDYEILNEIYTGKIKSDTLILNFNYTKLIKTYLEDQYLSSFKHIQIHGKVGDSHNKINFGFGDEMDEDYKMIENLDENEFLKNFKSFGYLQNSNYRNLLDFIELGKFQVIIMGHSCGISDRTMLNTIFEHHNCRSIKPYYYQWKDEEGLTYDNYTELVQNISRHFNKKKQMREKVVNKSLCDSLPQLEK